MSIRSQVLSSRFTVPTFNDGGGDAACGQENELNRATDVGSMHRQLHQLLMVMVTVTHRIVGD